MARLGIGELNTIPCESDLLSEGADIASGKTVIARIGKVSRRILKAFDIAQDVYYCDILWEKVLELARKTSITCQDLPKYPSVRRDLALLVDENVTYQQLHNTAFAAERHILKGVNLFDVYQGKNLPEGKKSYALSFTHGRCGKDAGRKTHRSRDEETDGCLRKTVRSYSARMISPAVCPKDQLTPKAV